MVLALVGAPEPLRAQSTDHQVVRLRSYEGGRIHRLLLGSLNRKAWSIPVRAPTLDLETFAGGLSPVRRGGGLQTRSLRFQSREGPVYTFRSIEKDATRNLDPQLRNSLAAKILQDQIGALFPLSAMVVAPLLEATGVLHARPVLVVLPDSPRLEDYREEFGGLVGWIEVRPDEGPDGEPAFAGADRVTSTPTLLERLEEGVHHRVDAEAFLRARLMDLYVGDWDRHPDQWRWAAFEERDDLTRWFPIPRDRDWALGRIDGVFWSLVRRSIPQYVGFGPRYTSVFGTVWNGRALDRQLLSELDHDTWRRVASDLQAALPDDVLERAISTLPEAFAEEGADILGALRERRDALPHAADVYYRILSERVDVFATDDDEIARVRRGDDGTVDVRIAPVATPSAITFERTFAPGETRGIRLYLRGGDDAIQIEGPPGPIWVRVIGGGGDDAFFDRSRGNRVGFYDDRGDNRFEPGPATVVDTTDYEEPEDTESRTHQARARDWGSRWTYYPRLGANQDVGAFMGQSSWWHGYGFRRFPYAHRVELEGIVNPVNFGFEVGARWSANLSPDGARQWVTEVDASSRTVRYFHGIGNGSVRLGDAEFHRADREDARLLSGLELSGARTSLFFGGGVRYSRPIVSDEPRLVQDSEPPGFRATGQFDLVADATHDTRNSPAAPTGGAVLSVGLHLSPALLDVEDPYGSLRGRVRLHQSAGPIVVSGYGEATLGFGSAPYYDLASLGGSASLHGFRQDRFLAKHAALAGIETRFPITPFFVLFPGTLGLSGFLEGGRVFDGPEDVSELHVSYGGGVWASLVSDEYTAHATVARSVEGTRVYFGLGFSLAGT